ncbi:ubiquitin/ISG15-conjugating enzyme E2 L6 isoform X1 [Trachypithecus francoisi]|uniref:ubiquitin/ISG15-conjugating enzyme E2 L6 isoform X1 n=1 Tax=Trachypithecus francoisi TaxID=54180 RepID=UPI00141A7060|nr:ubiquitin/ISG15-conjugating enzyme E2 L6 isoform X1 [Trachypithecus francoisi]
MPGGPRRDHGRRGGRSCRGVGPPGRGALCRGSVLGPAGGCHWHTLGPEMASVRVAKELEDLQKKPPPYLRNLSSSDANVLVWHALLLPDQPPYHLKAFNLCISFPPEYPFRPPTIKFTTKIYHPNVDESGYVCLPIISSENWKPCTKTCQVLEALNVLVNRPNIREPLRMDLADLLTENPELFRKNAEEFTLQYGVDRPS